MSKTLILLRNELKHQWLSSSTYVASVVFLVPMILFYWVIIKDFSEVAKNEFPIVSFFRNFWIPNLFVVPLITMKSIADDRRMGTLEAALTTPITSFQLVLSKFLSAYLTYLFLWCLTLTFPLLTHLMLSEGSIGGRLFSPEALGGCLVFIALSGSCFVAIGILCSSLTRSQLVAGMLCFTGVFILIVSGRLFAEIPFGGNFSFLQSVSFNDLFHTFDHFEIFSKGVLDLRPFVFYLSASIGLLSVASIVIEQKI